VSIAPTSLPIARVAETSASAYSASIIQAFFDGLPTMGQLNCENNFAARIVDNSYARGSRTWI
jgi:hypothetical protein